MTSTIGQFILLCKRVRRKENILTGALVFWHFYCLTELHLGLEVLMNNLGGLKFILICSAYLVLF